MNDNIPPRPIKAQPIFNAPPVVSVIIVACVAVFLAIRFLPQDIAAFLFLKLAFIPARFTEAGAMSLDPIATVLSPIGYTFLHSDWTHLLVNMGMFLAFGSAIARRLDTAHFLFLYFLGALGGVAVSTLFDPQSLAPMVGASAAISAMVGAISVLSFVPRLGESPPRPFHHKQTAVTFIVIWFVMNFVIGVLPGVLFGVAGRIAWEAHIGGFIAGAISIRFLLPKIIED